MNKIEELLSVTGKLTLTKIMVNHRTRCQGCPHGPYYYVKWRDGRRIRSIYIGRTIPPEISLVLASKR